MPSKRIVVIGAGACGLPALKCCLEEGLDVVCYEKTDSIGGLWRFRPEDVEGLSSVTKSTIIDSSKEMLAYSDFPAPKEYPNFMHNTWVLKYLESYAQHFKLEQHIKFKHMVLKVEPFQYSSKKQWKVQVKNLQDGIVEEQIFDGVMVCNGHHVQPMVPEFPGMDKFKGDIVHTHSIKTYERFKDKNVVIIGVGNSGCDAAVECSFLGKQAYLSTRRGCWVRQRVGPHGTPIDVQDSRLWTSLLGLLPYSMQCHLMEAASNKVFDHALYRLKPKHRILSQHPIVNDLVPSRILSGTLLVKGNVSSFNENGIVFEGDGGVETPMEAVVMATGYKISFPFIPDEVISVSPENDVNLYKFVFPPDYPTMAVMGLIQPLGSIFPIAEVQARWFAGVMSGRLALPSSDDMKKDVVEYLTYMKQRFYVTRRHKIEVDYLAYIDMIARFAGVRPNLFKLFVTDPRLFYHCMVGPIVSFQYRLHGPKPWKGARAAIIGVNERVDAAMATRKCEFSSRASCSCSILPIIFLSALVCFLAFWFEAFF